MDDNSTGDDHYVLDPNIVPPPPPILYYPGVPDEVTPTTSATSSHVRHSPESSTESERRSQEVAPISHDAFDGIEVASEDASYPSRHARQVHPMTELEERGVIGNSGSWEQSDDEDDIGQDLPSATIQTPADDALVLDPRLASDIGTSVGASKSPPKPRRGRAVRDASTDSSEYEYVEEDASYPSKRALLSPAQSDKQKAKEKLASSLRDASMDLSEAFLSDSFAADDEYDVALHGDTGPARGDGASGNEHAVTSTDIEQPRGSELRRRSSNSVISSGNRRASLDGIDRRDFILDEQSNEFVSINGEIDFEKEPLNEMTYSRQWALRMMHKKWYNPLAGSSRKVKLQSRLNVFTQMDLPSISKGWAYFEHVVLSRYVVMPHNVDTTEMTIWQKFKYSFTNYDERMERAQPGEKKRKTRLYDPISTPHRQLGDFGLGFGLYFSTLRALGYMNFLAGLMSLFSFYYFASDKYFLMDLSTPLLRGSAICTRTQFVPCIDCVCSDRGALNSQGWYRAPERCKDTVFGLPLLEDVEDFASDVLFGSQNQSLAINLAENSTMSNLPLPSLGSITLAVKNRCLEQDGYLLKLGFINYGVMIFLIFGIVYMGFYLEGETVKFDEDEQTAQDYSIIISNPPPRATDPEEWREYFEENFDGVKVAAITCAVNNDLLVKSLVTRREILRNLELCLEPGTPMDIDHLALIAAKQVRQYGLIHRLFHMIVPSVPELLSRLVSLNTSIKGLAQLSYPCTNVYVTFETERDQRYVLSKLTIGRLHVWRNNGEALEDKKYLFQGNKVLYASESVEPNTVRWKDLNVGFVHRMQQIFLANLFTGGSIFVCGMVVTYADYYFGTLGAAFSIAALNLGFPEAAKLIVYTEAHPSESDVQISLYTKIAAFRWVNTAIVITLVTPFTRTSADDGLIAQIYAIFFAEIVTTNVIQLTDVYGHFLRHVMAPRASSQDTMNLFFKGLEVELAERYTNMTKIMFLAFWYCSIFPGGFFFSALALLVNYYTDRFALMRTWQRSPHVSTEISEYSRKFFFSLACIFLVVMSSFYWAAFPFDNLCRVDDPMTNVSYAGLYTINVTDTYGETIGTENITVNATDPVYRFCNQDFILRTGGGYYFPYIYREDVEGGGEWMTEDQKFLTSIYGWTSVGILCTTAGRFLLTFLWYIKGMFHLKFDPQGDDQGIKFHDVRNIAGYIPQVRSGIFSYPLIVCKCDKIQEELFDWTDPDRDYEYYDLTKDADHVLTGTNRRAKHSFSRCKHWPPNRREGLKKKKRELEMRIGRMVNLFNSSSLHGPSFHGTQHSAYSSSPHKLETLEE